VEITNYIGEARHHQRDYCHSDIPHTRNRTGKAGALPSLIATLRLTSVTIVLSGRRLTGVLDCEMPEPA